MHRIAVVFRGQHSLYVCTGTLSQLESLKIVCNYIFRLNFSTKMTIIVLVTLFLFCVNATNEVEQTVVTISMLCYKNVMNTGQSGWRKTHKRNDNNSSHSHGATRTCQY